MTPDEILAVDAKRNHPAGTTAGTLVRQIKSQLSNQGQIVQEGETLIVFSNADGDKDVEFHCFNADTPENLARNVVKFFELAKKLGYKTATTPYKNPKISDLFRHYLPKQFDVKIDHKKGVYTAKVRL